MAPLVYEYASANPDVRFTVAGPPLLQPLFSGIENIEYLGLKKKQSFIKIYKVLNAVGADTVVDLHKVNRVGFALTLLRIRHLFNFHFRLCALHKGKFSRWLYLHHWYHQPRKPQYQRYDEVFKRAGLSRPPTVETQHAASHEESKCETPHAASLQTIGIAPFSQHKGKIWPWENTCQLVKMLSEHGYNILLFGSKEEAPKLEELTNSLSTSHFPLPTSITSLAGKQTFAEELEIIKGLNLMISMDSSNMHFASVLGVPVVSIWGATHPDFGFYPQQQDPTNALCAHLPCQPCSAFGQKPCRYGDYHCLTAITPQMVFQKIQQVLKDNAPTP